MSARRQIGLDEQLAAIRAEAAYRYRGREPPSEQQRQLEEIRAEAQRRYREANNATQDADAPSTLDASNEGSTPGNTPATLEASVETCERPHETSSASARASQPPRALERWELTLCEAVASLEITTSRRDNGSNFRAIGGRGVPPVRREANPRANHEKPRATIAPGRPVRAPAGCLNCHKPGHPWKRCPEPIRTHFCQRCNRVGVSTANCPGPHGLQRERTRERAEHLRRYERHRTSSTEMSCPRCFGHGHGLRDCPRPASEATHKYCVSCYRVGFTRSTCPDCRRERRQE